MFRLSKLTDYAVVVLLRLGHEGVRTASGLAVASRLPEPTVAKVLKALAASGLVISQRGAHGGYRLGRELREISVADVIGAIDGPIALTACVQGGAGGCDVQSGCAMNGRWDVVNQAVRTALDAISLADLRNSPSGWPRRSPGRGAQRDDPATGDRLDAPGPAQFATLSVAD